MTSDREKLEWTEFRDNMPFREKSAWIQLICTVAVWGYYFSTVTLALAAGQSVHFVSLFVGCVIGLVVLQIVLSIVAALFALRDAKAPSDERENLIALKAVRIAFIVLNIGIIVLAVAGPLLARPLLPNIADAGMIVMVNGILLAMVVAEVARCSSQIVYFRLGG
jgi:uncharacterized membrane protein (DUF485 family)